MADEKKQVSPRASGKIGKKGGLTGAHVLGRMRVQDSLTGAHVTAKLKKTTSTQPAAISHDPQPAAKRGAPESLPEKE